MKWFVNKNTYEMIPHTEGDGTFSRPMSTHSFYNVKVRQVGNIVFVSGFADDMTGTFSDGETIGTISGVNLPSNNVTAPINLSNMSSRTTSTGNISVATNGSVTISYFSGRTDVSEIYFNFFYVV